MIKHDCQKHLVTLGTEALLFQLELAGFLHKLARRTPEGCTAIATASSLDVIAATDMATIYHLQDETKTADRKNTMAAA